MSPFPRQGGRLGWGCRTAFALPFIARMLGHYSPIHISKMVLPTVNLGPPRFTVDTTIFEMWLGSLSKHTGLAIPVL